jgi:hypothetical protein
VARRSLFQVSIRTFRGFAKGLCSVGNNREKRFRAKSPTRKNHSPASLACYTQTSSEGGQSEYICADKDADYLRRDVDNPTLGIFRISACVASLIEAAEAATR